MTNDQIKERIRKVLALAQQGDGGEMEAAKIQLAAMPANQPNANWRTASVAPGRILITRTTKADSSKTARWLHAFEISSSKSTINAGQRRSDN